MTTTDRLRQVLKAIAAMHIVVFATLGVLSIHFASRATALKGTEETARQTAQKIESRIQRSSTIESAQHEARLAWKSGQSTWNTLVRVLTRFSDGLQALLVVPLFTFVLALRALWVSRGAVEPSKPGEDS